MGEFYHWLVGINLLLISIFIWRLRLSDFQGIFEHSRNQERMIEALTDLVRRQNESMSKIEREIVQSGERYLGLRAFIEKRPDQDIKILTTQLKYISELIELHGFDSIDPKAAPIGSVKRLKYIHAKINQVREYWIARGYPEAAEELIQHIVERERDTLHPEWD